MKPKFNLNRTPLKESDTDPQLPFNKLLERFKAESLKKAKLETNRSRPLRYTAVIAGITVVCVISLSVFKNKTPIHTQLTSNSLNSKSEAKHIPSSVRKHLNSNRTLYTVNNKKGAIIQHSDGSIIRIPKNAFQDRKGNTVKELVQIEFETYSGARAIMFSGINMRCDSAGHLRNFESAGMFEITALDSNVQINPQSNLEVQLKSNMASSKFRPYYTASNGTNWTLLEPKNDFKPKLVSYETELRASEALNLKPEKPLLWESNTEYLKFNVNTFDFPEFKTLSNLLFTPDPEYNVSKDSWYRQTWADVKIYEGPRPGCNYKVILKYRQLSDTLIVKPVYKGNDAEWAMARYQKALNEYKAAVSDRERSNAKAQELLKRRQAEQQEAWNEKQIQKNTIENASKIPADQKILRSFRVRSFGIYNSDYPHDWSNSSTVLPVFKLLGQLIRPDAAFAIDIDKRCVIQLNKSLNQRFEYMPQDRYAFCAIIENRVYACLNANTHFKTNNPWELPLTEIPSNELEKIDAYLFQ